MHSSEMHTQHTYWYYTPQGPEHLASDINSRLVCTSTHSIHKWASRHAVTRQWDFKTFLQPFDA